jgi:hypothetical protein
MNWTHTVNRKTHIFTLVIIDNFNCSWATVAPDKAHAELVVDANAVLACSVAFERFKPVTRRGTQKLQRLGSIELRQLALRYRLDRAKSPGTGALEQGLCVGTTERLDHGSRVLRET